MEPEARLVNRSPLAERRPVAGALVLSGLVAFVVGVIGLRRGWPFVALPFYAWVWWATILVVDGLCVARRGSSLLTTRRHFFVPMFVWSVTFWFLFEALNLRFRNWYYVGCPRIESLWDLAGAGTFGVLAFATVFIGIFEVADLLAAFRFGERCRSKPRPLPRWLPSAFQWLGAVMALLAVLFPYYLAPLIWGSVTFLLDPWNHRRGARSFLRDAERGDYAPLVRMLVAGLICGLIWESLNFVAIQKWIYTVRGLEEFKLFEMPLLGFLGFPGLALDCFTVFALLSSLFLGNRSFELAEDTRAPLPEVRAPRWVAFRATLPMQALFWIVVPIFMMSGTVGSVHARLDDLATVSIAEAAELRELGVHHPHALARALEGDPELVRLQSRLGWDDERVRQVRAEADLVTFKGIGSWFARRLRELGIERVEQLAEYDPEELHAALEGRAPEQPGAVPRLDWVRVWVLAARDRGLLQWSAAEEPSG